MRKILAIGKKDAYYNDRKELIGLEVTNVRVNGQSFGAFIGCTCEVPDYEFPSKSFYMVKLSREED